MLSPLRKILLLTTIIVGAISLYLLLISHNNSLKVIFLDVGQGDAVLIVTPHGRNIIIDVGPKNNLGEKLAQHMPVYNRQLDLVIMTHPDLDHVGGMLSLLDRYSIDAIMHSGLQAGAPIYSSIAQKITEQKIPTIKAQAGQIIHIDKNVFLEVYSPYDQYYSLDANDFSVIVRLVYGNSSILLTGDVSKIREYELVDTYGELLDSDILKVGHHGSQTSTSDQFVAMVSPDYSIISAGCDNRFGHPHELVLATLFKYKTKILNTCDEGDIVFESDGEVWVRK